MACVRLPGEYQDSHNDDDVDGSLGREREVQRWHCIEKISALSSWSTSARSMRYNQNLWIDDLFESAAYLPR
jgi:hypothetical protein